VHQELGKDLKVLDLPFYNLVPHIHDYGFIVIVNQLLRDLVQFRKELKALVINEVIKNERVLIYLGCSPQLQIANEVCNNV
jgi:hypothetical protein